MVEGMGKREQPERDVRSDSGLRGRGFHQAAIVAAAVVRLVVVLVGATGLVGACGPAPTTGPNGSGESGPPAVVDGSPTVVDGVITHVTGTSPTEVSGFTLRTSDGRLLDMSVGQLDLSDGAFPAGHLREHLATAEPVRVTYITATDGSLVAIRLEDAPS